VSQVYSFDSNLTVSVLVEVPPELVTITAVARIAPGGPFWPTRIEPLKGTPVGVVRRNGGICVVSVEYVAPGAIVMGVGPGFGRN